MTISTPSPGASGCLFVIAAQLDDDTLDRFRFSLMRLQLYADIHRNEDLEKAMHIKYVAQVLEKVVFGSLVMEYEDQSAN